MNKGCSFCRGETILKDWQSLARISVSKNQLVISSLKQTFSDDGQRDKGYFKIAYCPICGRYIEV